MADGGPRNGILSLTIKDKAVLYAAFMPFIKGGGLFIPTNKKYKLGAEVFILLSLMDEPEKLLLLEKWSGLRLRVLKAAAQQVLVFSSITKTIPC